MKRTYAEDSHLDVPAIYTSRIIVGVTHSPKGGDYRVRVALDDKVLPGGDAVLLTCLSHLGLYNRLF
jgi:hypothetical protein